MAAEVLRCEHVPTNIVHLPREHETKRRGRRNEGTLVRCRSDRACHAGTGRNLFEVPTEARVIKRSLGGRNLDDKRPW